MDRQGSSDKRKHEPSPSSLVTPGNDKSEKKSNVAPTSMPPPEESPEGKRRKTTAEPFGNLLRNLKQFGEKDPKIPEQATRLVGMYRQLWETYAAKCSENQNITNENQRLEQANKQLHQEKEQMKYHYADQEAHLEYIHQYFHEMSKGIADIVGSLGEHTTRSSEKALHNEKLH